MSETNHKGSCHCGAVRYEVAVDLEQPLTSCNCSICSRRGHLLSFVPAEKFKLLSGDDKLTDYQFNKKHIHHLFCSVCGVGSFARGATPDGKQMVAINARCLEDADPSTFKIQEYNGKAV